MIDNNYQDQVFSAARPSVAPKSLLRRANLNVYSNAQRRMQVVMAAAVSDLEIDSTVE